MVGGSKGTVQGSFGPAIAVAAARAVARGMPPTTTVGGTGGAVGGASTHIRSITGGGRVKHTLTTTNLCRIKFNKEF